MTEQALDLRRILSALKRRWMWLVIAVAVGVATGFTISALQAPTYVARSLVLLPPSPTDAQGRPLRDIDTEVELARSGAILERAGSVFNPPVDIRTLRERVETRGVTSEIIEVRAEAGRPADAKLLADAVANEYIAYTNGVATGEADVTIAALRAQAADLDTRIRELESDIERATARLAGLDQNSAEAARQAVLIDSMRSEQLDASRQLASLNGRIADARLAADLNTRGTRLLQAADTPSRPSQPHLALNVGSGGLIGLLAGVALVVALDSNDGRLRRRDLIAEAVGAPVLASVSVPRRAGVTKYRALLDRWRWRPNVVENLAFRQAFDRLGVADVSSPVDVMVVTLPGDRAAPVVALEWAAFAADRGTPTALVVASSHPTANELRAACASAASRPVRPGLSLYAAPPGEGENLGPVALTIAITVADGRALAFPTWGRRTFTVLAVSSGHATTETLAQVTLACIDAGHPIRGVLIANPDPADQTTGRIELLPPSGGDLAGHGITAGAVRPSLHDGPAAASGPSAVTTREAAP